MNKEQWRTIQYFNPNEAWGDPARMDYELLLLLDSLREYIGKPIYIHCGYETEGHSENSYHYKGKAVDCHITGISLTDFYIAATRFHFGGIGVYPIWNNPGLHLDTRPWGQGMPRSFWGAVRPKEYVALNENYFSSVVIA